MAMRSVAVFLAFLVLTAVPARAMYVSVGEEPVPQKRAGGVVFPVVNRTNKAIDRIHGWVYGYQQTAPHNFHLVANPHSPAERVTPGPHLPGKTALYWFRVPAYYLTMPKYGVVIFDAAVSFGD